MIKPLVLALFGFPLLFSLWVKHQLGLDIDVAATALKALLPMTAFFPAAACVVFAALAVRRMRSGELPSGPIPVLKHVALPLVLGVGLGAVAFGWVVLGGNLSIVLNVPTKRSLESYELFKDDRLQDKNPVFDTDLVDSRLFEGFQINASAAVIALGIEKEEPGRDQGYSMLYPSYASAAKAWTGKGQLLPSINALDGKAKQFDDGLMASLQSGMARGQTGRSSELPQLLTLLLSKLNPASRAYAWVWSGLKVGNRLPPRFAKDSPQAAQAFIDGFKQSRESEPYGFYTWSPELSETYRLIRFFRSEISTSDPAAVELAALLARDSALMARYAGLLKWSEHVESGAAREYSLSDLAASQDPASPRAVSFLPSPRSKEDLLFNQLFGQGLPPGADLMLELVKAIRSGRLDLKPGSNAGWYEYQAYALETFLLPERGAENQKLMLDKEYKKRMLKAFASILAKRRETQGLFNMFSLGELADDEGRPKKPIPPRLRVEPNPTYFIRMARSYSFLEAYLQSIMSESELDKLRGLKEGGKRGLPLGRELAWMKTFFYGLHLISCEDIGMKPLLLEGELPSKQHSLQAAADWLSHWRQDPDLSADTRIIVPVAQDIERQAVRYWATLGVHAARLNAHYARAPQWRTPPAKDKASQWESAETSGGNWIILVDDFAEIESRRPRAPTRDEFRAIVDRETTREKVVVALSD